MPLEKTAPAARSERLPHGVDIQPRRFSFESLDSIRQYWMAENALLTHGENTFSIFIPPGERFFIRSVRAYEDQIEDPELRELARAFAQQEAWHMRAHDAFNAAQARFGIDVEREQRRAEAAIARMERWLPKKMRLGATVFLEHLTATGAHMLFELPILAEVIDPGALGFWRWHAVEELEHKAVAFDVYTHIGGGYVMRVVSALAALALLAGPTLAAFRRMLAEDGARPTRETHRAARALQRRLLMPHVRMIATYFRPGFHPWQVDDGPYLRAWYASAEAS